MEHVGVFIISFGATVGLFFGLIIQIRKQQTQIDDMKRELEEMKRKESQ
jgi:hypothetical protein